MMMREDCDKGFFVSFDYSEDALHEIESFFKRSHKAIVALTNRLLGFRLADIPRELKTIMGLLRRNPDTKP